MKLTKLTNGFFYVVTALLLVSSALFIYIAVSPVDVLQNWTVTTPQEAHPGEVVTLTIKYRKVRAVSGPSFRELECKNINESTSRYPIDRSLGNRPVTMDGQTNTIEVDVQLPDNVPNLPRTCHITTTVNYTIYTFRTFTEFNQSNDFRLTP